MRFLCISFKARKRYIENWFLYFMTTGKRSKYIHLRNERRWLWLMCDSAFRIFNHYHFSITRWLLIGPEPTFFISKVYTFWFFTGKLSSTALAIRGFMLQSSLLLHCNIFLSYAFLFCGHLFIYYHPFVSNTFCNKF